MIISFVRICLIVFYIFSLLTGTASHLTHSGSMSMTDGTVPGKVLAGSFTSRNLAAHACGEYNGMTYTNSLEALNANYKKGFRFFEADFNYTTDRHIVLIHDWSDTAGRLLGIKGKGCSYYTFKTVKPAGGLTLMDIDMLVSWLKTHYDAFVITDCKGNNLTMLRDISRKYPDMVGRLFPQMGPFNEYTKLRKMGYQNIILALYKINNNDDEVVHFVMNHSLYAVSMPGSRAKSSLPLKLERLKVRVYAHTINSPAQCRLLFENGVFGIYTDSILPAEMPTIMNHCSKNLIIR